MNHQTLASVLLVGSLTGCAGVGIESESDPLYKHVVRMDHDGSPVDLMTGRRIGVDDFKMNQLAQIVKGVKRHLATHSNNPSIMIYVHGAPLFRNLKSREARRKLKELRHLNPNWYPVILAWNGTLAGAYSDHLFRIRQGRRISALRSSVTWPAHFFSDMLTSIGRAPSTWTVHANHMLQSELPQFDISGEKETAAWNQRLTLDFQGKSPETSGECMKKLRVSPVYPRDPKASPATIVNFPLDSARRVPLLAISPLIASFGSSMWTNYNRRAQAAVRQGSEFEKDGAIRKVDDDTPSGALAVLFNEIARIEIPAKPEFILIGHSTGTIILTELISARLAAAKTHAAEQTSTPPTEVTAQETIKKMVFLGAASTLRDFSKTVVPYLKIDGKTRFYNVSLNGYYEARATYGAAVSPSLLEWIDISFARPASHTDRVMGKWENVMLAVHTIPCDLRDRIELKHLPSEEGYPRAHRDLDKPHVNFNPFKEEDWNVRPSGDVP